MSSQQVSTKFRPYRAILAGFCGSSSAIIVLLFAHIAAQILAQGLGEFSIVHALANNDLTEAVSNNLYLTVLMHFVFGFGFAMLYAKLIPMLPGHNSWRSGLIFSVGLWLLASLLFFPAVGAGFFALELGAGILPALGALILHLAYGITLGLVYSPYLRSVSVNRVIQRDPNSAHIAAPSADKAAALGILGGAAVGTALVAFVWLLSGRPDAFVALGMPIEYAVTAIVFLSTGVGLLLGFWTGLPNESRANNA